MKNKKLLSILLALVLALSLAMPLAPSARAEGPYKVGIDDIFNGSVTADKETANEGETVRLTVTPSDGYIIESISVYAIDLYTTVPTTYSEGNYVFTMPASEVQISATFKAAPAPADTEIPSVALSLTLPAAGGSYSGAVPAAVSISSGTGFTVKSANWFNGGTLETNPGCGLAPTSFEPGKPYYAEIFLAPAEGYAFADGTAVTIDTLGVKSKAVIDDEADRMGWLYIVTEDYTIPAATGYIFKGVSFELAGLNQLTSGSDAGKWMPATPIDWTKILVSIDPGANSAIQDSTLVEAHFDFLYTDAACTTILTGDMQDTGTYYLRLVVNNKNAEDHSIDYSSLAAEHCSATVAGYTTNFVSAAATTFAGKDAVGVVFSVTRNSTPAAPYTITVNGGKAYKAGGVEITSAAEGDSVYILFYDDAAPGGKYIEWGSAVTEPAVSISAGMISGTEYQAGFIMPAANFTVSPDYQDQKSLTVDLTGGTSTDTTAAFNAVWSLYRAEDLGLITADISDSHQEKFDLDKDGSWDVTYSTNDSEFSVQDSCSVTGDKTLTIPAAEYSPVTFKFPASPATTYTVTLIAYDKTNGTEQAGGEVAFSDSGKGTRISGDYEGNSSRTVGVYPASDYTFIGWAKGSPSGEIVSTSSPYTFTVTEDVTLYALFEKITTYPVWVGGVQVTSANKDDILGDGKAKYDPDSKILTLDNPTISGPTTQTGVIYAEIDELTITGKATLNLGNAVPNGIEVAGNLIISGAGTDITATGGGNGILAKNITISGGTVNATGRNFGVQAYSVFGGNVTISGGSVTAKATGSDSVRYGINGNTVSITGGTVTATSTQYAIGGTDISISGGTVTATGDRYGISQSHEFSITGGTLEATGIEVRAFDFSSITVGEGLDVLVNTEASASGATAWNGTDPLGGQNTVIFKYVKIEPGAEKYPVWVGETQVTSANKDDILGDGGKAKFDPASNTLTLNGVTVSTSYKGALIYAEGIDLTITGKATLKNDNTTYGVLVKDGSLNSDANLTVQVRQYGVSATKSININGGSMNAKTTGHGSDGVGYALGGSDIKISSGTVTAETAQGPAISAANTVEIGGGTVNVTGGYQGVSTKSLTISGGTVTVEGDWNGVIAEESVTISGGSVTATGGRNGIRSDLYDGQILISGGTVKATGTSEIGISGACPIDITGGTVEAKGGTAGIQTSRNITIGNGITKVTADGASNAIRGHSIGLGDALIIQEPAGGTIGYLGGGDTVLDGTTVAAHAVIEPKAEKYPVWVGGVQVTSANKDDILGDGGKAKFDPDTNTLTLNNPTISGYYLSAAIWINVSNATVTGALDLTVPSSVYNGAGISYQYSSGTLTLNGDFTINAPNMGIHSAGSVSITGGTYNLQGASAGIYAQTGNISISGGAVTARATGMGVSINGIRANNGSVVISGGTVTATGRTCGIYSDNDTIISGGEVTAKATGTDSYGINAGGNLKIENGITKVTADGTTAIVSTGGVITLGDALIIEEPAGGKLSSDGKAIKNADDTEAAHAVIVPKGVTYPVWVGGVQVTSANKDDILGDGTASFDPDTNTLTLNGLNVGDGYHASGASIVSTGIDLTVKGSATLSGGGYGIYVIETTEGGGNLTLDGADITYTVPSGSDTGIRADGNISISGGTIDVTAAKNGIRAGSSVTISGGSVTATGSECGISVAHGDVTISGGTVNAKSDTVGIEATNGTIKIQNGTTSVTADGAGAAIGAGGITIGDEMMIKEPAGGFIGDITGSRVIKNPDDTTATHTVIVPKEAEKFPVEVVITTHDKDGNVISTVGGTATADKTEVAKGDTITVTVTPNPGFELESIEFSDGVTGGYQAGKETSSTVPNDFTTSTGKLQIDVLFKETAPATTHTVTFEANGGTPVPAAQTVADGEKAVKPADPTRSGFVFDGWYADATFAAAFDFGAAITADVTVYAKWKEEAAPGEIVYTIVSGGNSTWTKGSSSGVTIVVKRDPNDEECFSHFTSVQIGSTTLVSGTDYTAVAGSTVITLNASTLQKLTTGTKTVTINFDDGKAATDLTIKAGSSGTSGGTSPKTGDNSNPGLWLAVMVLSGLGIGGLVVNDKKRRYVGRH